MTRGGEIARAGDIVMLILVLTFDVIANSSYLWLYRV